MMLTILFLLLAGGALCFIPKGELHLLLCSPHTVEADIFFHYYTMVGEWVPYAVAVLLFFYRKEWGVLTLAATALSGLTTQLVKHIVDAPRPLTWFAIYMPDVSLPLVEGVKMSNYYSFPSGHTTSFFAFFLTLSFLLERTSLPVWTKCTMQTLFFLLALLGGYSRIYLSQHFLTDVLGGTLIGVGIALLVVGLADFRPIHRRLTK